jgi:hypothetical protein
VFSTILFAGMVEHSQSHAFYECTVLCRRLSAFIYLIFTTVAFAGMIKRIRGVAYSMKVSAQSTNRMVRAVAQV